VKIIGFGQALKLTLYRDNTRQLRLIMALVNVTFAHYLYTNMDTQQFETMLEVMGVLTWVTLLGVNATFLMLSLRGYYSKFTLFGEGILGGFIWWITAITNWSAQGGPGPSVACAIALTIISVNYPTHKHWGEARDD
jgi:hypothetical protein